MKPNIISKLFLFAGLSNILGVLIFSKFFTNSVLLSAQPAVMSYFGLISIILWGLAYISVRNTYAAVPWLLAVFTIEKAVYVLVWLSWLFSNSPGNLYDQDTFAGLFFSIYGVNDLFFGIFFGYVFLKVRRSRL
ncbi:hypothetical protein FHG64_06175 [Antarcticibacterium flavum]|uniref:Uncharacterized protein n=1 Tax=Antarcticibacterium flavum TaxID=2058175 RepID=A0A5B7X0J1_9FLAO|nr:MULTISPECIES: hypothetical protein [Antarcticibacterium]MCM4161607.1 hypothetical protein [Antarcticibacterium sp. W02-3]QCY69026.1 hypothetical protein FHG64_06175 [Antarcticibacterium flavum]